LSSDPVPVERAPVLEGAARRDLNVRGPPWPLIVALAICAFVGSVMVASNLAILLGPASGDLSDSAARAGWGGIAFLGTVVAFLWFCVIAFLFLRLPTAPEPTGPTP